MKKIIFIVLSTTILSCGKSSKENELEQKELELIQKERQLLNQEKEELNELKDEINQPPPPPPPPNMTKFYALGEGDYPQGSEKILTNSDFEGLSTDDIKILRNEIYARHGYIFKSTELHNYFYVKPWYKALSSDVSSVLTKIEQKNIAFIKKNYE